jgi:transaldolase
LNVKIFGDGADLDEIGDLLTSGKVSGFTTNPSLMRKAGVTDYATFARTLLCRVVDLPVSFEVLSDDLQEMRRQACVISSWAHNVYVKIPVTNTLGEATTEVIRTLTRGGVKVNVTAVFTMEQIHAVLPALTPGVPSIVSIFAGRIANAGVDPEPIMRCGSEAVHQVPGAESLWASPREPFNVVQADRSGCDIITMTPALIAGMASFGKNLAEYSLETVAMFYQDAQAAKLQL